MTFFVLCVGEAGLFLALLSLYRAATKPDASSFFVSLPGIVCVCSFMIAALSTAWIICTYRSCDRYSRQHMLMACGMNLLMLLLTLGSLEALTRILSIRTESGEVILGIPLHPRVWSYVAAQRNEVTREMADEASYIIHDSFLGWTVAPSSSNKTGEEMSSREGLRSPRVDMEFADLHIRHSGLSERPASVRVAVLGDSMTFGYEVRCEETWGHVLEALLQPHAQVLNFGVAGYGINQVFRRYEKDARPWRPDIVVIGITSEMMRRIHSIYPFLMNPEWGGFPFVRPRLVIADGVLKTINDPVPHPEEISVHSSIHEIPHLDLDDYYDPLRWERTGAWNLIERSYVFRFVNSLRPPSEAAHGDRSQGTMHMSQVIIQYFIREVLNDDAVPFVVYFPYQFELHVAGHPKDADIPLPIRMLRDSGIEFHDMTGCLTEVGSADAYTTGGHYSPQANVHISHCLEPALRELTNRLGNKLRASRNDRQ